jgi:hypothetical protein
MKMGIERSLKAAFGDQLLEVLQVRPRTPCRRIQAAACATAGSETAGMPLQHSKV